jgi:aspartate/glutamate racemase/prolyl-tRNA editing enzyme YbaK/EbsC (Cys-tRNA(Pro) deacylase)
MTHPDLLEPAPPAVLRAHRRLEAAGIWHRIGTNSPATSCRDAAARRVRLGHQGIPLWDELRSLALVADGDRLVFVHCRGDQHVDLDLLTAAIGVRRVVKASPEHLAPLGLGYGLINPFGSATCEGASPQAHHVIDTGLQSRLGRPGTMMTNAGDLRWSVEFYPDQLVTLHPQATVAPVARGAPRPSWLTRDPMIGILTGNAPESGTALMHAILRTVRNELGPLNAGDISMPRMRLASIPELGYSMELNARTPEVWRALATNAQDLLSQGADIIGLACNTTHHFQDQLRSICGNSGAEFVSMPDAVGDWLRERAVTRVGLVGIESVSSLGEWSAYAVPLRTFAVDRPSPSGMRRIEEIAYQVKLEGANPKALGRLRNVLRDVLDHEFGSEFVILALTELSLLAQDVPRSGQSSTWLDPLEIYGQEIARRYLGTSK